MNRDTEKEKTFNVLLNSSLPLVMGPETPRTMCWRIVTEIIVNFQPSLDLCRICYSSWMHIYLVCKLSRLTVPPFFSKFSYRSSNNNVFNNLFCGINSISGVKDFSNKCLCKETVIVLKQFTKLSMFTALQHRIFTHLMISFFLLT